MNDNQNSAPNPGQQIDLEAKLLQENEVSAQQANNPASPVVSVASLQKELSQMTETCKRAMADLDNYKKGMQDELRRKKSNLTVQILRDFLPLLDSFERSKKFTDQLPEEHRKGIEAIYQQLKQIFDKYGVQAIPSIGQKFDGTLHEAMMQGPGEESVILDEFEKGYIINNLVIRHAKVKIGNGTTH